MIRTTVYPSYGVEGPNKTTVLIASYTWTSDAAAIGALVTNRRVADDRLKDATLRDAEDRLKDVVLRDLSHVQGVPLKVLLLVHACVSTAAGKVEYIQFHLTGGPG